MSTASSTASDLPSRNRSSVPIDSINVTHADGVESDDEDRQHQRQGSGSGLGIRVPTHPITCFQGPFTESMQEAFGKVETPKPKNVSDDAAVRRQDLLDKDVSEITGRWRQKPGQKWHELWKLIAQISFGTWLLIDGVAKDDEAVLSILQGHVDEVDCFLETTLEDFDLAQEDIDQRLQCLKIPLESIDVFDKMLEDRSYRSTIVDGNQRIEEVITRTTSAKNAALKDVENGLNATKEFAAWLGLIGQDDTWMIERPEMVPVYEGMKGNTDGWYKAHRSLQMKGKRLSAALERLGSIVAEMDRRAAEVSRNMRFSFMPNSTGSGPRPASTFTPQQHSPQTRPMVAFSSTNGVPEDTQKLSVDPPPLSDTQDVSHHDQDYGMYAEPSAVTLEARTYSPAPSDRSVLGLPTMQRPPTPDSAPPTPRNRKKSSRERLSGYQKGANSPTMSSSRFSNSPNVQQSESPRLPPSDLTHTMTYQTSRIDSYGSEFDDRRHTSTSQKQSYHENQINLHQTFPRSMESSYFTHPHQIPSRGPSPVTSDPRHIPHPTLAFPSPPMSSPRSAQSTFIPVNASPHSPLQRPWTAAGTHVPRPSGLRAQSSMNLSTMTGNSTNTKGEAKLKKKKSTFGWFKKAFSLSEEEKAEFERRKRAQPQPDRHGYGGPGVRTVRRGEAPAFQDGRRMR